MRRRVVMCAVLAGALVLAGCTSPGIPTPPAIDATDTANDEPVALATGLDAP